MNGEQLALQAPLRALARRRDPSTSKRAAASVAAPTLSDRILQELRKNGPGTSHDLAARMNLDLVSVSPRMRPLARADRVVIVGEESGRTVWDVPR